ncbi:hypothetical protein FWG95_00630 [Candidatus Saccharibacteria bacterium]|nr:hypothetical protein [Candidatus Saccharibacteria bacterium]
MSEISATPPLIEKIEPEIIPKPVMFGLSDEGERDELISVVVDGEVKRVNLCYPLDDDVISFPELVRQTLETAAAFLERDIVVSMCGINTVKKMKDIKRIGGKDLRRSIAHFNGARHHYPEVAAWCAVHGYPYIPSANTSSEIEQFEDSGYDIVKAIPWLGPDGLHEYVREYDGLLHFNAAGGIQPVDMDEETNTPLEVNPDFVATAGLEQVRFISATHPIKVLNREGETDPLGRLEEYFRLIRDFRSAA